MSPRDAASHRLAPTIGIPIHHGEIKGVRYFFARIKVPHTWYMVFFDKKSIEPFQQFVLGKESTLFPNIGEPLEWLQNASLVNPAKSA